MWKLVIEDDEGKRTVVPLTRDEYTIGRKEGNSIRLTERNVSRDHAKIARRPGATKDEPIYSLGDLTSYNGVYVNGIRVADKQDLADGDLIQIGDYRIVLQDEATESAAVDEGAIPVDPDDLKDTLAGPTVPLALRATNATFLEKPNRLVVLAGPNPGEEFPLIGERLTIGRAEDATISVNHNSVSRLHCEVHSLGEGRFEIVDKGSSNGVRVNGADLRRGIIEAGDIIELGDVKFKFVGEGQLFRPGANDSQPLAAISQRSGVSGGGGGQRSVILPVVLLATVAAIVVVGFLTLKVDKAKSEVGEPEAVSSAVTDTTLADSAMLADARRMADIGQVEEAHAKAGALPPASPLHASADFQLIELKWAAALIFQADSAPDAKAKNALLQRIVADPYVDATTKREAQGKIAAIAAAVATATATSIEDASSGKRSTASSSAKSPASVRSISPTMVTTEPPPPHATPKPSISLQDLIASSDPNDWQKARERLEPRVFANRGTPIEVRQLLSICKNQHDQTCVETCRGLQRP